jgi:integral membrane sensor domain MASE1
MVQLKFLSGAARQQLLLNAALPAIYFLSGRLGLLLAVPPGYATAIFLPAGIAAGAVFIAGPAALPGIFVGSFLLNICVGYSIAHELCLIGNATALVIALASTLQAAIGGLTLRRIIGYPAPLETPRDLFHFHVLSPAFFLTSASLSLGGMWALGAGPADELPM